jgi:hypothetical protein
MHIIRDLRTAEKTIIQSSGPIHFSMTARVKMRSATMSIMKIVMLMQTPATARYDETDSTSGNTFSTHIAISGDSARWQIPLIPVKNM